MTHEKQKTTPHERPDVPNRLALGIERLGLAGLRFPRVVLGLIVILSIVAAIGIPRMQVDDSLGQLFRSKTPEFQTYENESKRFPSSEFDVLVAVQGARLLEPEPLNKLRDAVTDLQLVDGATGLVSLFSARDPPPPGQQVPPPLFPQVFPTGPAYAQLIDRIRHNQIIQGKLLSDDGHLALIVVALDPKVAESSKLAETVAGIRKTMADDLAGTGLTSDLSGVPVMQLEIREALGRDRAIYNAAGFAIGALIAAFFLRRWRFVLIAAGPPLIAIILSLGLLAWMGFRLNMLLNLMSPLVMVISFADSMQLTYAFRTRLVGGAPVREATRGTLWTVGPACVLTHVTAAISFTALQFSSSLTIQDFGRAGLICTIVALLTMLLMFPMLSVLLLRDGSMTALPASRDRPLGALRGLSGWIAHQMVDRPGAYAGAALVVILVLASVYFRLQPQYRLSDQVPDSTRSLLASAKIDQELTGSNPIDVLIEFPPGQNAFTPQSLGAIADVHALLEQQPGVANVWSLDTLQRWLAQRTGSTDIATLKSYFNALPKFLTQRFVAPDAAVVSGRIPDADASVVLARVNRLEAGLDQVRARHPGYTMHVTGLLVVAARSNAAMVGRLNEALTAEALLIACFIGLAFRSLRALLASILPAVFPVFAAGGALWLMGSGLQLAAVIALMASFGVGLSATIHFLNRLRLESQHEAPLAAIESATVLVGPALILTSVVLSCTLLVTVFSGLPLLRLFGWLSAYSMLAALLADLFILRPIIALLIRWRVP